MSCMQLCYLTFFLFYVDLFFIKLFLKDLVCEPLVHSCQCLVWPGYSVFLQWTKARTSFSTYLSLLILYRSVFKFDFYDYSSFFFSFFNILKSYSLESCAHSSLSCIWYQLMTLFVMLQSLQQIFKLKKDRIFAVHEQSFNRHEDKAIYFNLLFIFKWLKGNIILFTSSLHFLLLAQLLLS